MFFIVKVMYSRKRLCKIYDYKPDYINSELKAKKRKTVNNNHLYY